jgi:hypothetical protein
MKPTYTLHKLPQGYVLTSDEKIKEGNYCFYEPTSNLLQYNNTSFLLNADFKKVISQQDQFDFSALSPEDQKEIGWVDVEELYPAGKRGAMSIPSRKECNNYLRQEGFRKAQELLGGFTLEDIKTAFKAGEKYGSQVSTKGNIDEYIQSLSQPKSWEVEVEMETVYEDKLEGTEFIPRPVSKQPKLTNGKVKVLKINKLWQS